MGFSLEAVRFYFVFIFCSFPSFLEVSFFPIFFGRFFHRHFGNGSAVTSTHVRRYLPFPHLRIWEKSVLHPATFCSKAHLVARTNRITSEEEEKGREKFWVFSCRRGRKRQISGLSPAGDPQSPGWFRGLQFTYERRGNQSVCFGESPDADMTCSDWNRLQSRKCTEVFLQKRM